ncbi:MAG TPA: ATP-binding cassette domain-containing protein [Euzebyales bacterium]|nr:ATP-binding cassette domain-containing protein [Euzebyales bacterium]
MTDLSRRSAPIATTDDRVLRLDGVSKTYTQGDHQIAALAPTHLSVRTGSFVAVMGPSGSGKTTMLMLMGGLAEPTTGHVLVEGRDVAALSPAARPQRPCC